jgi:protein PhnA
MTIDKSVFERSNGLCEVCSTQKDLIIYAVDPQQLNTDNRILVCATCSDQITGKNDLDANHWRCLNDSIWSEKDAVKVLSWRMLNKLKSEGWPQDLLDVMYLDEDQLRWAESANELNSHDEIIIHRDSNGAVLQNGDSVVLIKELDVKGASFAAKRGTPVRNIRLVADNPDQIEGKIEGQTIVILTKYVKK